VPSSAADMYLADRTLTRIFVSNRQDLWMGWG
jgi:hypothetical protein